MSDEVIRTSSLTPQEIVALAKGARLVLSHDVYEKLATARQIVDALVEKNIRGYGINTGVGGLCDVVISQNEQSRLSHNILFSHACGVGEPLSQEQARAVMVAQINNFAHGYSGIRPEIVEALIGMFNAGIVPEIPSRGSLGYLTHAAAIGLLIIGQGRAFFQGKRLGGSEALAIAGYAPFTLKAKEGLCLVNGSVCATGLGALALARAQRLVDWADCASAFTYAILGQQNNLFADVALQLRHSPGLERSARNLRYCLENRTEKKEKTPRRVTRIQDPMSLRSVPQVHGAVRDSLGFIEQTITQELASVTDNPLVMGSVDKPQVHSQAHAVSTALAFSMDHLSLVMTQIGMVVERRIDRLLNPAVSGLPAFLARQSGVESGLMIAQYTTCALCGENRRLAQPASLDGGITSALQEDVLPYSTPAAWKAHHILDNLEIIVAIELLSAAQAYDLIADSVDEHFLSPFLANFYQRVRRHIPCYSDDRPLNDDFKNLAQIIAQEDANLV